MPIYKQRQELTQAFKNQSQSHDIWEDMSTLLIPFSIIYKPFQFLFLITRDVLTYLFENCFQKRKRKLEIHPNLNKLALPYTVYEIQVTSFCFASWPCLHTAL